MTIEKNTLTREEAQKRFSMIKNISYSIELKLKEGKKDYHSTTLITFTYKSQNGELLTLDFITKEIVSLELNDNHYSGYIKNLYSISIPLKDLQSGKNKLKITYINDFDKTGSGFHKFIDPIDNSEYLHTDFEPYDAHRLFPCFDQPDLKARYQLSVTGPAKWNIIHNTLPQNIDISGDEQSIIFQTTEMFSTYLFALVAGPYEKWEDTYRDIPLGIYCRNSLAKHMDAENIFSITKESFKFLENYFDYPYPYSKYDQIFVPEFNFGAMENVGCVTFTEKYIFRHTMLYGEYLSRGNTIAHEMVHMWFGDLVTMKWWNDLWLNESFADYLSYFCMSNGELFSDALEHFFVRKEWAYYQDQLSTTHPIAAEARDTDEAFTNFDGISYSKGASVLRQLQYYIGDINFKSALHEYFVKFKESNTTLNDFLELMSQKSGIDIIAWSSQWLETTGVNTLKQKIESNMLQVTQLESQDNELLREHSLEYTGYKVKNNRLVETEKNKILIKDKKTAITLTDKNTSFCVLNTNDYDYIKVFFSENDIEYINTYLNTIDNTFTRRIIWGSLWQMVLDNELSPITFIDLALNNSDVEEDLSVLHSHIVSKVLRLASRFLTDENYTIQSKRLYDYGVRSIKKNNAEEKQIILFNILISTASDQDQLLFLHDLLQSKEKIVNMDLDQDKRWSIIARLVAYDYSNAFTLLEKEKKSDPTDLGIKKAFLAEVAVSDFSKKETYFKQFLEDEKYSIDYLRYGMQGFHWRCQKEMLKPFIDSYFDNLKDVFTKRDVHYASAFGALLFPSWEISVGILNRIENILDSDSDMPTLLVKDLKEHRDNLKKIIPIHEKQQ